MGRWLARGLCVLVVVLALGGLTGQGRADAREIQMEALFQALDIAGITEVMRDEGLVYGDQIAEDLMPDADPIVWAQTVSQIYATDQMQDLVEQVMRAALHDTDLTPLVAFYTSSTGQRITQLELSARRAFLDETIEAEAQEAARAVEDLTEGPRAALRAQVLQIMQDSDLVEMNVMGALNANLMFMRGLVDGGASDLGSDDLLGDVWSQEEATRADTRDWLIGFLMLAYTPLTADEVEVYAAMWRTPEGRDLNRALFAGFNDMYDQLSYLLARSAAEHMQSAPL